MAEWLDIVNKHDQVIGRGLRPDVHRRAQYHRSTHVLLYDSRQRLFLQLRSKTKDTNPGLWDTSAAGHVDAGESYLNCAARELYEELGVLLPASELVELMRLAPEAANGYEFVRVYAAISDAPITLEPNEIEDGKWVSETELDQWLAQKPEQFTETFATIWLHARGEN